MEREAEYFAAGKCLIFNLAERSQASLYVKGIPMAPSCLHREHARDIDEVHAQIRGFGKVQRFAENDSSTFYQETILAPGTIHEKFYDEQGRYPWHQYRSITPCIYMPVEIDR